MSLNLSNEHVERIKEQFKRLLGRDLTPDELRYLGLSLTAFPGSDSPVVRERKSDELLDEVA